MILEHLPRRAPIQRLSGARSREAGSRLGSAWRKGRRAAGLRRTSGSTVAHAPVAKVLSSLVPSKGHTSGTAFDYQLVDKLRVPTDIPPGEYILSWRWDCEETPQVWNSCADLTIA